MCAFCTHKVLFHNIHHCLQPASSLPQPWICQCKYINRIHICLNQGCDTLVIFHFGFILFVIIGGFLLLRWRFVARIHIPCAIWDTLIEFAGWICPLKPLENDLCISADNSGYSSDFIEQYIIPVIYPSGLNGGNQLVLGIGVILINICAYSLLWLQWSRIRRSNALFSGGKMIILSLVA